MNQTVNTLLASSAAVVLAMTAGGAQGQAFPAKPIKIVIPFPAGGSSDIVGRAIGSKFQEFLGQPAVVENRPGANGAIAATPEEFGQFMKAEVDRRTRVVERGGIKPD